MTTAAQKLADILNAFNASRGYAICMSHEDPICRRAALVSHAYETAKRVTGYHTASYDPRVFITADQTTAAISLIVDGWRVCCVVDLVLADIKGEPRHERMEGRVA